MGNWLLVPLCHKCGRQQSVRSMTSLVLRIMIPIYTVRVYHRDTFALEAATVLRGYPGLEANSGIHPMKDVPPDLGSSYLGAWIILESPHLAPPNILDCGRLSASRGKAFTPILGRMFGDVWFCFTPLEASLCTPRHVVLNLDGKIRYSGEKENSFSRCYDLGRRRMISGSGSWSIHCERITEVVSSIQLRLRSIKSISNGGWCSPSGAFLPSSCVPKQARPEACIWRTSCDVIESLLREYYPECLIPDGNPQLVLRVMVGQ